MEKGRNMTHGNDRMIDLIIPCYNPPPGWAASAATRFAEYVTQLSLPVGLIVVNDGSVSPNTKQELRNLKKLIPSAQILEYQPNRGKGYAIRQGILASQAPYCLFTDADFPYTTDSLVALTQTLLRAPSPDTLIVGRRSTTYYTKIPLQRKILSVSLRLVLRTVFRLPVDDSQAGLKGFGPGIKTLFAFMTTDRFLFDLELLVRTRKAGKAIQSVPVFLDHTTDLPTIRMRTIAIEIINLLRILRLSLEPVRHRQRP
jgi:glycosyltransferase involved in cell wall biosynthesis